MNFNKAQLGAIEHKDGAMLVLADRVPVRPQLSHTGLKT